MLKPFLTQILPRDPQRDHQQRQRVTIWQPTLIRLKRKTPSENSLRNLRKGNHRRMTSERSHLRSKAVKAASRPWSG